MTDAPGAMGPGSTHVIVPPPLAPAPVRVPPFEMVATTTPTGTVSTTVTWCAGLTFAPDPFVAVTV